MTQGFIGTGGYPISRAKLLKNVASSILNYGNCVDIFAPGSAIKAAMIGESIGNRTSLVEF